MTLAIVRKTSTSSVLAIRLKKGGQKNGITTRRKNLQQKTVGWVGWPINREDLLYLLGVQNLTSFSGEAVVLSNRSACFLKLDLAKEARDLFFSWSVEGRVWQVFVGAGRKTTQSGEVF